MKLGKLVNFHFSLFHNFLWHTAIIFNFLCWRAFKVRQACGYTALNSSGELLYCNRGGNVSIVISTNWFGPQRLNMRWNWPTFLPKYATAHPITIFEPKKKKNLFNSIQQTATIHQFQFNWKLLPQKRAICRNHHVLLWEPHLRQGLANDAKPDLQNCKVTPNKPWNKEIGGR